MKKSKMAQPSIIAFGVPLEKWANRTAHKYKYGELDCCTTYTLSIYKNKSCFIELNTFGLCIV